MKYIFDFDDVLFNNTKQFKPHMYDILEKAGIPRTQSEEYYKQVRQNPFSLRKFIAELFSHYKIPESQIEKVYEEIMRESPGFLNVELLQAIQKIGIENCYIITYGDPEFQKDKMRYSGIYNFFNEERVRIVKTGKEEALIEICKENENESVIFFDDKEKHLKLKDQPHNLVTQLFEPEVFNKWIKESSQSSELKKRK